MSNTQELNLFFPINELNPIGWLNDFITPQIMKDKDSIVYSMLYKDYDLVKDETKNSIKQVIEQAGTSDQSEKRLFQNFIEANKRKFKNEDNFLFINARYSDILENNVSSRRLSNGTESDSKKYLLFMNNIKPYQIAFLQPYVRLYYGWKDNPKDKNEKFQYIEFPFSQYFELDKILETPSSFMEGSGIKNVNVDTQFTIGTKRNCRISIEYYFSSINILTRELEPPPGKKPKYGFSFMKLFSHSGIKKELLQLEYGYHIDPKLENQHGIPPDICSLINQREVKKFNILKTAFRFSFKKEGGVTIGVDYTNLHEASLSSDNDVVIPSASRMANIPTLNEFFVKRSQGALNLLVNYKDLKKQLEQVKEELENIKLYQVQQPQSVSRNNGGAEDLIRLKKKKIEILNKKENELNKQINLLKRQLYPFFKNLFLEIIKSNCDLYSITFNSKKDENLKNYSLRSTFNLISPITGKGIKICDLSSKDYSIDNFYRDNSRPESVVKNLENILNRLFNVPANNVNNSIEGNEILFFPLRALIRAAYQVLDDPDDDSRPYIPAIIFGNFNCRVYDQIYNVNTGNILIEVNEFQKWMHHKFTNKGFIEISFGQLLNEIMDDLVPNAIYRNKTYPQSTTRITFNDYNPTFFLNLNGLSLKHTLEHEEPSERNMLLLSNYVYNTYQKEDTKPLIIYSKLNISTHKETTANNFSFAAASNKQLRLNEQEDASRGIPHLIIGSDGGMFLDADFSQIDLKGLRSAITIQSMIDDNSSYFYYKYSLSANVIGSSIFNFGSIICVPSPPFALANAEYDTGIVGYYKVKGLKETIDANGSYKTTVSGDWFWDGGTSGKRGKPISPEPVEGKKISDIKDYIPSEIYDPDKYIDLLIKTDVNTIINFGLKDNKKEEKKDKTESKKPSANKPRDKKEPKPTTSPPGKSKIKTECPDGEQLVEVGINTDGSPILKCKG